ncbi:MAG: hypothetical protein JG764_2145 [Clostridiales bacterium]|jgi:cyclic lactone autoinducer peptide|nr:hypothetical protein [Clostridiales bacterium]
MFKKIFPVVASIIMFVAAIAAQPMSVLTWHQPEVPKALRK